MDLVPYMYYERQEAGSQLCAQHCLNNILQQYTYSEFDLAEIAKKLDQAENAALAPSNQNKKSYNLDDTGFFSISVLERALEVWDLTLVRWRGEAMKPYQEHPEDQAAFILNLSSHWLPLRRFSPNPPHNSATKRWYNLNSFLPNGPEWISPTYLRMVLAQAEEEGYSVFVLRKAGRANGDGFDAASAEGRGWTDGGIGALPECEADRLAVVLGEPVGRTGAGGAGGGPQSATSATGQGSAGPSRSDTTTVDQPTVDHSMSSAGPSYTPARRRRRQEDLTSADVLPFDDFTQPAPRSRQHPSRGNSFAPDPAAEEPDIDIFDSDRFPSIAQNDNDNEDQDEEEDEPMQIARQDADDADERTFARYGTNRGMESYGGPTDFAFHSRSYDDEDEALQAALKASMADIPDGWEAPELLKDGAKAIPAPAPAPLPAQVPPAKAEDKQASMTDDVDDDDDNDDDDGPTEVLSADEIRRRRLARFAQ